MIRKSIIKISSILLIIGLNWAGLSAIIETVAYLNDAEDSSQNAFSATTLDFSLNSSEDFAPPVTPVQNSTRDISISNDGILGFQYTVQANNFNGELCNFLNLEANLDGDGVEYSGLLIAFDDYDAGEFSAPEDWQFTASLANDDPSLENQTCTFDFVFDGVQIGGTGFSDQETISNTITSGTWTEPETYEYSPIADSYVDQKQPDSNYGGANELKIRSKNCPENERTFIKFNFNLPSGTTINSAYLRLYMKAAPSDSRTYEANRVLASWKENNYWPTYDGIDWNNQPSVYATPTASVSLGDANPKWLSWDVTSDVQGMVNGTYSNYGWRLSNDIESSETPYEAKFHSRESSTTDKRPILEITFTAPEVTTAYPAINEVYYDVGGGKGWDPDNEWIEIYNPTNSAIDISGWKICDNNNCDTLPVLTPIPAKGFAVASGKTSTWDYWSIPVEAIKIDLPGDYIGGNGLRDDGDRVILRNASNVIIDAMSYGDDTSQLNPSVPSSGQGKSLARIIKGYDTNSASDWIINATPNPGTNPSIDGIETITFTYQGVEFLGSELASNDEEINNDLPEEEIVEEEITEETSEEVPAEETPVADEITPTGDEQTEEGIIDEIVDEIIEEIMPTEEPVTEELITPETPVIEEETVIEEPVTDEQPVIEEEPATEEQPVAEPNNDSSQNESAESGEDSGGSDGSSDDGATASGDSGDSGESASE